MAIDKSKNTQVLVTFPNDLLEKIDEHWHDQKLKNRNETIRELVRKALEGK